MPTISAKNNQAFRCTPEINLITGSLALIYITQTIRFVPHKERIPTPLDTPIGRCCLANCGCLL
jgi:hypothetical protein